MQASIRSLSLNPKNTADLQTFNAAAVLVRSVLVAPACYQNGWQTCEVLK